MIVPVSEQILRPEFPVRELFQSQKHRDKRWSVHVERITLHGLEIGDVDLARGAFDHVHDALGTESIVPVAGDEIRIIPGLAAIVRRDDIAFRRVEGVRQLFEWDKACPFIFIRPAGHRQGSIAISPQRNIPRHLITNISIHISIQKILCRHMKVTGSCTEFFPVLCFVEPPDSLERRGGRKRCPSKGNHILLGQIHTRAIFEWDKLGVVLRVFVFQWTIRFRDDRSVPGGSDRDFHRIAPHHLNRFAAGLKIHPFPVDLILVRVLGIDPFDI